MARSVNSARMASSWEREDGPTTFFDDLAVGHDEELLRQALYAKIDSNSAPFVDADGVFDGVRDHEFAG